MARSHQDNGPHALSTLALHRLKNDELIRKTIEEMHLRSGHKPWYKNAKDVDDVDLVNFFNT